MQVGLVSASGLSQLLVLAAAAAQPYKVASTPAVGKSQAQQQHAPAPKSEQQQQHGGVSSQRSQQLPEKGLAAMALMPDKVWMGLAVTADAELSSCACFNTGVVEAACLPDQLSMNIQSMPEVC